jgi:hypothetical protein
MLSYPVLHHAPTFKKVTILCGLSPHKNFKNIYKHQIILFFMAEQKNNNYGIASLVLGILGAIFILIPFIALIFSILAIVFGVKQKKIYPNGISSAGLVLGIIVSVLSGLYSLLLISAYFGLF